MTDALFGIADVEIDSAGTFKYIQILVERTEDDERSGMLT